jgi:hypothetical protein
MEEKKIRTLDELRQAVGNPKLEPKPPMIVHYGKITLHIESDGFSFDGNEFHQSFTVVREIKPERQKRKPKETQAAPQASVVAGGKGKK